tara:strand:+ start:45 stop:464 length:420 start_codon:yes stop_codon:yes gene_type:complete
MKKITDALEIARELEELSGLSPFRHTRQRAYIDVRATLTFLLYNNLNFTLAELSRFYKSNGKPYDHATALHSLKNFETYRRYNSNIDKWLETFQDTNQHTRLQKSMIRQNLNYLSPNNIKRLNKIVTIMYEKDKVTEEV